MEYLALLGSTIFVNNIVLAKFLGLCPLMGVSNNYQSALGMGLATTFVLTLAALSSWCIQNWILEPLNLEFLQILSFILVIAALVQFTELVMRKISPLLHKALGVFLPLITTNCAVLGVALLNVQGDHRWFESLIYGFGSALGFTLVMLIFASIRERLAVADLPAVFEGIPVAMMTTGFLSLAFMGFSGM
jgi:electron transport complex protein RnfA